MSFSSSSRVVVNVIGRQLGFGVVFGTARGFELSVAGDPGFCMSCSAKSGALPSRFRGPTIWAQCTANARCVSGSPILPNGRNAPPDAQSFHQAPTSDEPRPCPDLDVELVSLNDRSSLAIDRHCARISANLRQWPTSEIGSKTTI